MENDPNYPMLHYPNFWIPNREELSGRYNYHSTKNNSDVFVRDGPISKLEGSQFYLIRRNGCWFITNEQYALDETISDKALVFQSISLKPEMTSRIARGDRFPDGSVQIVDSFTFNHFQLHCPFRAFLKTMNG